MNLTKNSLLSVLLLTMAIVTVVGGIMLYGNNTTDKVDEDSSSSISNVETSSTLDAQIKEVIKKQADPNVYVIDVRTDEEWNESHAVGALHWGLEEKLKQGELPEISKDADIYVYCRSGNRSGQAVKILEDAGFTNVTNIQGLSDWIDAGGETESGNSEKDERGHSDEDDSHGHTDDVDSPLPNPSGEELTNPDSFTLEQISTHNAKEDCWLAISGKVYNVTLYIDSHHGGPAILEGCGKDATTLFETRPMGSGTAHSETARNELSLFQIGILAN